MAGLSRNSRSGVSSSLVRMPSLRAWPTSWDQPSAMAWETSSSVVRAAMVRRMPYRAVSLDPAVRAAKWTISRTPSAWRSRQWGAACAGIPLWFRSVGKWPFGNTPCGISCRCPPWAVGVLGYSLDYL